MKKKSIQTRQDDPLDQSTQPMRLGLSALRRKERQDIEFRLQGRW